MTATGLCIRWAMRASTLAISGAARAISASSPNAGRSITALTASNLLETPWRRVAPALRPPLQCDNAGAIGHGQADPGRQAKADGRRDHGGSTTGRAT